MAINTRLLSGNANPYASSAVVADTMPVVDYFIKQKAHQAALDEAAVKSSLDKINDIKTKGVRAVDTPDLINITNRYAKHAIENKVPLANTSIDGGKKYLESKGIYGEAITHTAKSDAARAEDLKVAQLTLADTKAGNEIEPENVALIAAMSTPVTDPRHYKDGAAMTQPYTSADWKPRQTFDPNEFVKKAQANAQMSDLEHPTKKAYTDKLANQIVSPYIKDYNPKNIENIALAAAGLYNQNKAGADKFLGKLIEDPNELNMLQNVFQQQYKRPMGDGKDMAVAYALSRRMQPAETWSTSPIKEDWREKELFKASLKNKEYGNGEAVLNNVIGNGVPATVFRLPNSQDKNDKGVYYKGYKEIKLDIPIAERFTPKDEIDGKLVRNASTRWLVNEDGTKFAAIQTITEDEKKQLDKIGKGANVQVGDIKIPNQNDWVSKSQIAQAYQKEYPKGEGNLQTNNNNTLKARQEASKKTKSVSYQKIKSLVGTKGYEGYSQKELEDYYKSNGFTIN